MEKPWYSFLYIKSPITKIVWGIASILVAIVAVLAVGIMENSRMEAQTANWDGRSIEKGAEIYANNCYTCHGPEGKGGSGPALNSKHFFENRLTEIGFSGTLEDYVQLTVAAGRPSNAHGQWLVIMPTWSSEFGGPLRPDQVQHVTNYVLNWESTAILQTPEEDPFIPFANIPTVAVTGTATMTGTGTAGASAESTMRTPEEIFGVPPGGLGCVACHNPNLPEGDSPSGQLGPNLGNLAEHAGNRVPGEDAVTYVHNSIVNPGAFTVPGYQSGIMPPGLDTRMTPEELDALVNWLLDPNRVAQ
jgi:mono/diheme cytochrome c family protein